MATSTRDLAWEAGNVVGVPFWVTWGVQGMETDYGRNISTSSAGAMGLYQFTAADKPGLTRPYPMQNSTHPDVLAAQALAGAQYLKYLHDSLGSWNAALWAYSGNGYAESQVMAKARGYAGGGYVFGPLTVKIGSGAFGPAPGSVAGLQAQTGPSSGDPPDHSPKTKASGDKLGKTGTSFQGHARAMRNLAARSVPLKG